MFYKDHCKRTKEKLGKDWAMIHRWLDEFAKQDLMNHRRVRHHAEGIAEIKELWGEEAEAAAIMHVIDDCGFIPDAKYYDDKFWGRPVSIAKDR
ncbi:DUF6915 family protein [Verrucomicrobiota bacterium]